MFQSCPAEVGFERIGPDTVIPLSKNLNTAWWTRRRNHLRAQDKALAMFIVNFLMLGGAAWITSSGLTVNDKTTGLTVSGWPSVFGLGLAATVSCSVVAFGESYYHPLAVGRRRLKMRLKNWTSTAEDPEQREVIEKQLEREREQLENEIKEIKSLTKADGDGISVPKGPYAKIFVLKRGSNKQYWTATAVLWTITVLTYGWCLLLVVRTGGPISSPFAQYPVALIALAPMIMSTYAIRAVNVLVGGGAVLLVHLAFERLVDAGGLAAAKLPDGYSVHPLAAGLLAASIAVASVGFPWIAEESAQNRQRASN